MAGQKRASAVNRGPKPRPAEDRFLEKVQKGDASSCWLWTAYVDRTGYGRFMFGARRSALAHRVSYELSVGPVPAGMQLDHLCRVRHCVNPHHLEPVTQARNIARGIAGLPQRKLTDADVVQIRSVGPHENRLTARLARQYGVARSTIRRAANGETYKPREARS